MSQEKIEPQAKSLSVADEAEREAFSRQVWNDYYDRHNDRLRQASREADKSSMALISTMTGTAGIALNETGHYLYQSPLTPTKTASFRPNVDMETRVTRTACGLLTGLAINQVLEHTVFRKDDYGLGTALADTLSPLVVPFLPGKVLAKAGFMVGAHTLGRMLDSFEERKLQTENSS